MGIGYNGEAGREINLKLTISFLLPAAFMLLLVACGEESQTLDLLTAIDKEKSVVVQELLDSGIDPNKDPVPVDIPLEGAYPLHLAVVKGNKEIVQILLDNGAQIDLKAKNKDEATPLHWAAFFGQKDMVTLLIKAGAPINTLDGNHATPVDSVVYVWRLSQDDEGKAKHLMEIITILKANGGKPADDL